MKLAKVVSPEFKTVLEKLLAEKVAIRAAFKLSGVVKRVNDTVALYNETRMSSLKRYANLKEDNELQVDEKGNAVFPNPENETQFFKELQELLDMDISIDKLKLEEFGTNVQLSGLDVIVVEELFSA